MRRYCRASKKRSRRCSRRFSSSDKLDLTLSARFKMLENSRFKKGRSGKRRLTRA